MNALAWVITLVCGFIAGWYSGRVREWMITINYLHRHEDKPVWWIAAGIAADCHKHGDDG